MGLGRRNVSGGDSDESSGRAICARLRLCKAIVSRRRTQSDPDASVERDGGWHANSGRRSSWRSLLVGGGALLRARSRAARAAVARDRRVVLAGVLVRDPSRRPTALVALRPARARSPSGAPLSIAWSVEPDRSWDYANRTLVYLAFALVGAYLGARRRAGSLYGFSVLLGAVCVWALAGKVLPWLYEDYGRIARLRAPIGYWNALALLGDIALPIGLCLATRRRVGRDAARLRLARRDRADLLARRRARRGRRRRALDVALARVDRGALDARRGRAARGRRARPSPSRSPASRATGSRTPRASTTGSSSASCSSVDALIAVGALALRAAGADARPGGSRSPSLAVAIAASVAVGAAHAHSWWNSFTEPSGDRAHELAEPPRLARARTSAGSWWTAGVERLRGARRRRHRRRLVRRHEPALPAVEPRPDDRAAQPARSSS